MKRNYLLCLLAITFSTKLLLSQTTFIGGPISIWTSESYLATPYPGTIDVSDLSGVITKITVTLNLSRLIIPDNIDILLVGPGGQNAIIMSDVGGSLRPAPGAIMLDDDAVDFLPDEGPLGPGTFKPTNIGGGDSWPSPAPSSLSGTSTLSVFNGTDPNGTWSLYVLSDGEIENTEPESIPQWELNITVGGCANTYYQDNDNDGYGNAAITTSDCSPPTGYVSNSTDCDDQDAAIYPGAAEVCDAKDNNCDGQIDEGVTTTFYADADGDGYGNAGVTALACSAPEGYVSNSTDCDDSKASVYPGATEVCNEIDDNCDGLVDEGVKTTFYRDVDNDSYGNTGVTVQACIKPQGYATQGGDCNDNNAFIFPGATEFCDRRDNNCNGQIDEVFPQIKLFKDADQDGFGDPLNSISISVCSPPPAGYVSNSTDCDDSKASVSPGVTEVCNGIDDDCDGLVDEGVKTRFYSDADGDGYGNAAVIALACSAPESFVSNSTDCDDSKASVYPGATEVCNGIDDDCDGAVDEGLKTRFYRDADGDGFGNAGVTTLACSAPASYVSNSTDCDDSKALVYPGATEVCNEIDDDCDGQIDEGIPVNAYYRDADGDGYGNAGITLQSCSQPTGYISNRMDCNDNENTVNPGASEICDEKDNDCDGQIDEGVKITFYEDLDGDGYGKTDVTVQACSKPATNYAEQGGDCNDNNAAIHPGATEICGNIIDENCDGQIGEGCPGNPFIVIIPAVVYESQGVANLPVRLSKKSTKTIKVNYKTVNGTAKSPGDYTAKNGTVTIPPGSQTQTISVIIKNDNITEPTEYFTVKLSQPVNATIGLGTGIVGIRDGTAPSTTSEVPTGISDKANNPVQEQIPQKLTVNAYPNPSTNDFKIDVKSNSNEPVKITVTNASGIVVGVLTTSVQKQPVITVGKEWRGGTYFAEVVQGKDRKVLKLIKIN